MLLPKAALVLNMLAWRLVALRFTRDGFTKRAVS